jgi:hypothetical protein
MIVATRTSPEVGQVLRQLKAFASERMATASTEVGTFFDKVDFSVTCGPPHDHHTKEQCVATLHRFLEYHGRLSSGQASLFKGVPSSIRKNSYHGGALVASSSLTQDTMSVLDGLSQFMVELNRHDFREELIRRKFQRSYKAPLHELITSEIACLRQMKIELTKSITVLQMVSTWY